MTRSVTGEGAVTALVSDELHRRIFVLEEALEQERSRAEQERSRAEQERSRADALERDRDRLLDAYKRLQLDLELLRRRIFVAKAERVDTGQLELEFGDKLTKLKELTEQLGRAPAEETTPLDEPPSPPPPAPENKPKPKGRRNLGDLPMFEERFEILDPVLEATAKRIDFEVSYQLGWRKGGSVRIVTARAKYLLASGQEITAGQGASAELDTSVGQGTSTEQTASAELDTSVGQDTSTEQSAAGKRGTAVIVTVPMPKRTFPRSLAAPSLLAKIIVDKHCDGLPLYRQEERFEREGLSLDRGTMCRWIEDCGMTVGCVVLAMRKEAFETAFCIATDATGVAVQPEPSESGQRQACRKGHFFVLLADRDSILFEYLPRETSEAVAEMFRGYHGYVQADAKSVYDILFRQDSRTESDSEGPAEVGCWAHCRRKFYEAAIAKDPVAREALFRIGRLFENERKWAKEPPAKRKALRLQFTKPMLDDFFAWADIEHDKVKDQRGLLRTAFGYAVRQREALIRFLDDGRLRLDNNASERALRRIAVGRKAWLFVGSDDHAQAAANLFSLIACCKLHRLDPEAYLTDLFRILVHWPRDRYLELAPQYWARTRARLDPTQLAAPLGELTIPPPEQSPPS